MNDFLKRILRSGSRTATPATPRSPMHDDKPVHELEKIGEFPCGDMSIVVRAYDSQMGINGQECFVRRYPLSLRFESREKAIAFSKKHGGNLDSISPDHSILFENIPGELMVANDWLSNMSKEFKERYAIELPVGKIMEAIIADGKKNQHRYNGYMEPLDEKDIRRPAGKSVGGRS